MTVLDASTPAQVENNTASITTASFTPPAGAILVALLAANGATGTDVSFTSVVNSGTALTWTRRARKNNNASSTNGAGTDGGAEIWTATVGSSAAMTVTATGVSSGVGNEKALQVVVFTGASNANLSRVAAASSTSGTPATTITGASIGSYVVGVCSDWAQKGLGTAGTGQTIISEYNLTGQITFHFLRTTAALSAAGSQAINLTAPTLEQYNLCAIEILSPSVIGLPDVNMAVQR